MKSPEVSAYIVGDGPLCGLLIPGGPGLSAKTMEADARLFSGTTASLLVDPPGTGGTPDPDSGEGFHPAAVADFYAEICDRLKWQPDFVIGVSFGGLVASYLASSRPDLVPRLVLVSAVMVGVESDAWAEAEAERLLERHSSRSWYPCAREVFDNWTETALAAKTSEEINRMNRIIAPLYCSDPDSEGIRDKLDAMLATVDFNLEATKVWESGLYQKVDSRPSARGISCPTLIVTGQHDWLAGPHAAEGISELIAGSELVVLDDCGHYPVVEAPGRYGPLVSGWLQASV